MGVGASILMLLGSFGAAGVLVHDPILTNSPLGFWRYGHGSTLAAILVYAGVGLMAWAWVLLGREVLAERVGGRAVVTTSLAWIAPLLLGPPLFTRDAYSYLAQGALPLMGFDPYAVGPEVMPGIFTDNVHPFWQDTPAPYGPLFILIAKGIAALVGDNVIVGVLVMRIALLPGLALLIWALPQLTRKLGGRTSLAMWLVVANPVTVILLIGGGHNDLLVIGLLAAGAVLALRKQCAVAIVLITAAMAIKATAAIALPFIVLVWAAQMPGATRTRRIVAATAAGLGIFAATFALITVAAQVDLGWLPALSAPSLIVNWMSIPTGVGEFVHFVVQIFWNTPKQPFINVARVLGGLLLLWILVKQWWASRDGGPDAIRRAGIVLVATSVLSPATLPWYPSWGTVLLAAAPWRTRWVQLTVVVSLMLIVVYYPNGEDALYNPLYLVLCLAVAVLAAVSLVRPDPLRLAAGARSRKPVQAVAEPVAAVAVAEAAPAELSVEATEVIPAPGAGAAPASAQQRAG